MFSPASASSYQFISVRARVTDVNTYAPSDIHAAANQNTFLLGLASSAGNTTVAADKFASTSDTALAAGVLMGSGEAANFHSSMRDP